MVNGPVNVINKIIIIYTLLGIDAPEGANKTLITLDCILIYLTLPCISWGLGKLGCMYGELTFISSMESDLDSNL